MKFYQQYTTKTFSEHPGLITLSKWCDYLTFEILFGSGTQPTLDFGLSGGKFFFDGLRVAERFARLLGKDDEAASWRKVGDAMATIYTKTFLHSDPGKVAAKGLFMRQTGFVGYATPCDDWVCWYDSTWNVVLALRSASDSADKSMDLVSLQAIPETGLAPCTTNSNNPCPWFLVLLPDHTCIVQLDNGTAAFAKAATWMVVPGLSNASAVTFQSVADPTLYISSAEPSGKIPGSRVLRALSLSAMGGDTLQATWSVGPANVLQQSPPVSLPPAGVVGEHGGWHSFRSLENKSTMPARESLATTTFGNLSTLAAVGNTQTLTALAIASEALPPEDRLRTATVLLNDLLSEATFCAPVGKTAPPQNDSLCWNARGHNRCAMPSLTDLKCHY